MSIHISSRPHLYSFIWFGLVYFVTHTTHSQYRSTRHLITTHTQREQPRNEERYKTLIEELFMKQGYSTEECCGCTLGHLLTTVT